MKPIFLSSVLGPQRVDWLLLKHSSGMPANQDPEMAFILVQHLAPDHKSILTQLIQHYTRMVVSEVEDGMEIQVNHTYIIPPNCDMAILNGKLQLLTPSLPHGQRSPIDFSFGRWLWINMNMPSVSYSPALVAMVRLAQKLSKPKAAFYLHRN